MAVNKDDELLFADETESALVENGDAWKILIADDEEEVHAVTQMVLEGFSFEGKGLKLLSAFSGRQTIAMMQEHPDTAVLILDVVMEEDTTGLDVVKHIRNVLQNRLVRIILRTGQPGQAPEHQVTMEYDINDYKGKTELTAQKLLTTLIGLLRAYRDLRMIERSRRGLEHIASMSASLFSQQSMAQFSRALLTQLSGLLQDEDHHSPRQRSGLVINRQADGGNIQAGIGGFMDMEGRSATEAIAPEIWQRLMQAAAQKQSAYLGDEYLGYFSTKSGAEHLIYLQMPAAPSDIEHELLKILEVNATVAFENIELHQDIIETQREVILTVGKIVGRRLSHTEGHLMQLCAFARRLALAAGLDDVTADMLRLAVPLHDVGTIGISDLILQKYPNLTDSEWEAFKRHPLLGYKILKGVKQTILKLAAQLALEHHEHWDGGGYPNGLRGEQIHLFARILRLADAFDQDMRQMGSPTREALNRLKTHIAAQSGKEFDPVLTQIFLTHFDEFFEEWERGKPKNTAVAFEETAQRLTSL